MEKSKFYLELEQNFLNYKMLSKDFAFIEFVYWSPETDETFPILVFCRTVDGCLTELQYTPWGSYYNSETEKSPFDLFYCEGYEKQIPLSFKLSPKEGSLDWSKENWSNLQLRDSHEFSKILFVSPSGDYSHPVAVVWLTKEKEVVKNTFCENGSSCKPLRRISILDMVDVNNPIEIV